MRAALVRIGLSFKALGPLTLLAVIPCAALHADPIGLSGSGFWNCAFSPSEGYGATTSLSFTAQDASGNPISGTLFWGQAHEAPQCTPGMQPFQGVVPPKDGGTAPIFAQWSYLGQSYSTTPANVEAYCQTSYCYASVSVDQYEDIGITLGYDGTNGLSYLTLAGYADITSSSFGQAPANDMGEYPYYSDGTFTVTPEPATLALLLLVGLGLSAYRIGKARLAA